MIIVVLTIKQLMMVRELTTSTVNFLFLDGRAQHYVEVTLPIYYKFEIETLFTNSCSNKLGLKSGVLHKSTVKAIGNLHKFNKIFYFYFVSTGKNAQTEKQLLK